MANALTQSPLAAALAIHAEALASGARVVVLGDSDDDLATRLLDLGARVVHVYDPDTRRAAEAASVVPRGVSVRPLDELRDVRDGAYDLAIVPDLAAVRDAAGVVRRLRRSIDARGAVIALATAERDDERSDVLDYAGIYDLFALEFEHVAMTGVLPFSGVVFAELGAEGEPAVSVDTRLVEPPTPSTFVVVAARDEIHLDPYAIVQVPTAEPAAPSAPDVETVASFAAIQLQAELMAAQLDEHRRRLVVAEARTEESKARESQLVAELDAASTRASELERVALVSAAAMTGLERRLRTAEQGMLERDDLIAKLNAEIGELRDALAMPQIVVATADPTLLSQLADRADRAETTLALHVADLAQVADAHAEETRAVESQLRERAGVISALEKEIVRREQLVRELVAALEEAREGGAMQPPELPKGDPEEVPRLRRKLDELAMEVARREGELVARGWRIAELEGAAARAGAADPEALARANEELDALRQALTQEHAARVAAESRLAQGETS